MSATEYHVASGEGDQGQWKAETWKTEGSEDFPDPQSGQMRFSVKNSEFIQTSGTGQRSEMEGQGTAAADVPKVAGVESLVGPRSGEQNTNGKNLFLGSETSSLEGCQQGPCPGGADCGGGMGPRGYGMGDE